MTFSLYVVINIAMVTGLIPVVGVPLPLISYGGTAMMTVLIGFGLMLSVDIHRDVDDPPVPGRPRPLSAFAGPSEADGRAGPRIFLPGS